MSKKNNKKEESIVKKIAKAEKSKREWETFKKWIESQISKERVPTPLKERLLKQLEKIIRIEGHKQPWQNDVAYEKEEEMPKYNKEKLAESVQKKAKYDIEGGVKKAGCCCGKKSNPWMCFLAEFRKKNKDKYDAKEMLIEASKEYEKKASGLDQLDLGTMGYGKKHKKSKEEKQYEGLIELAKLEDRVGMGKKKKSKKQKLFEDILELAESQEIKGKGLEDSNIIFNIDEGRKKAKKEMNKQISEKAFENDIYEEKNYGRALEGVSKMNQWRYNSDYLEENRKKAYYQYLDRLRNMF